MIVQLTESAGALAVDAGPACSAAQLLACMSVLSCSQAIHETV